MAPEIALAASAREWPDRLHRFLLDHGGGVVVARVMSPEQALDTEFNVVFIDDICSFLTPRLITGLRRAGKQTVGVFDPDDGPDAKRRLLECGISDVIECDATPTEFLDTAVALLGQVAKPEQELTGSTRPFTIGVLGTIHGVGSTEVAIGIAAVVARSVRTALVDLDPYWPSVAQRLDLPLHPNIRSALDAVVHRTSALTNSVHRLETLAVVAGVADGGKAGPISASETGALLEDLGQTSDVVICDLGPLEGAIRGVLRSMDTVIVVGSGDPVGLSRLIRTVGRLDGLVDASRLLLAVNQVSKGRFKESEIRRELSVSWPDVPLVLLPVDRRVSDAAWEGRRLQRGPFHKAVRSIGALVTQEVARER